MAGSGKRRESRHNTCTRNVRRAATRPASGWFIACPPECVRLTDTVAESYLTGFEVPGASEEPPKSAPSSEPILKNGAASSTGDYKALRPCGAGRGHRAAEARLKRCVSLHRSRRTALRSNRFGTRALPDPLRRTRPPAMPGLFACFRSSREREHESSICSSASSAAPSPVPLETSHPDPTFVPRSVAELHPEYAHAEPYHFAARTESARCVLESASGATATLRAPPVSEFIGDDPTAPASPGVAASNRASPAPDAPPAAVQLVAEDHETNRDRASLTQLTAHMPPGVGSPAHRGAAVLGAAKAAETTAAVSLADQMASRRKTRSPKNGRVSKGGIVNPADSAAAKENSAPGQVKVNVDGRSTVHRRSKQMPAALTTKSVPCQPAEPAAVEPTGIDNVADLASRVDTTIARCEVSDPASAVAGTKSMPRHPKPSIPSALSAKSPKGSSYPFRKTVSFREEKPTIFDNGPPPLDLYRPTQSPAAAAAPEKSRLSMSFDGRLASAADSTPRPAARQSRSSTAEGLRATKKRQSMAVRDALTQQIRGVPRSAMLAFAENDTSESPRSEVDDGDVSQAEPLSEDWFDDTSSAASGTARARELSNAPSHQSDRAGSSRVLSSVGARTRSVKSIRLPPPVQQGVVPPPPPPPPFEPTRNRVKSVRAAAPAPPPARESFLKLKAAGASEAAGIENPRLPRA